MASLRKVFTMEHVQRTVIRAVIFMLVLPLATCESAEKLTGQQSLLLTHAVKTLLGFSDLPPREKSVLPTPGGMGAASRYMVEMYNRHKHGAFTKGQQTGNTVRSIHADIGVLNGERVFLFNLSSIKTSESVFSGELHFYKPRRHNDDTSISMHIYEVAPMYMSHVQVVPVHSRSVGWQVVDVTASLSSCLATNRNLPHLLAVTFLAEQRDGDLTSLSLKKFMKYLSMPFLVVFANETQTLTMDHLDPYFIPLSSKEKIGENIRDQEKAEDDSDKSDKLTNPESPKSSKYNRRKRSVLDNRIPDDPREIPKSNVAHQMPETHPSMLSGRITSRFKIPKTALSANNVKSGLKKARSRQRVTERLTNKQKSRLLPPPEFYGPTNRRRHRHRRRRKYRRRRLPVPKDWQRENVSAPRGDRQRRCSRRRLVVDFMDIGWGEWIISPKSFSANYCAGECRFPLSKKMKPSNHATIQSIVKAVGLYKGIPAPCCVPDVMSSVTLLYFDESKNVVLKNYPGMSVESCACR